MLVCKVPDGSRGRQCSYQLSLRCLIFESAAFMFPPRERTDRAGDRMCDQAKGRSRASFPAGGLWPKSPLEAGVRVADLKKKKDFWLHSHPHPPAK